MEAHLQKDRQGPSAKAPISSGSGSAELDKIKLDSSWKKYLIGEFEKPYMKDLKRFLLAEYAKAKKIYPKKSEIFSALNLTPFDKVRAVIIGQDPYHGPGQAHGLCFSVREGIPVPPSLQNIFQELAKECGFKKPRSGDLTSWARQGVLLLNATLTVEEGKAGSHQNRGWEIFTDKIVEIINREKTGVVFFLWGSFAQKKAALVDAHKHLILKSAHPSPLSSHRGFFGNGHFVKANSFLEKRGEGAINWQLP